MTKECLIGGCNGRLLGIPVSSSELLAQLLLRMDGARKWRCDVCGVRYSWGDRKNPYVGRASLAVTPIPVGNLSLTEDSP